jgi:membrane protein DedA with SNARE-associated domain
MEQAREFLTHFQGVGGYITFFFIIMGCGMGLPFNSDLCLIAASVLAAMGYFNLKILMILAWFAILTGDTAVFFVGRKWGKKLLSVRPFSWLFKPEKIAMAETFLNTRGTKFLFIVRFLPLIRTVLFFTAGSLQVAPRTFFKMDTAATFIYLPLLMGTAYYTSENIDEVIAIMKRFQFGLLAVVFLVSLALVFRKKNRRNVAPL